MPRPNVPPPPYRMMPHPQLNGPKQMNAGSSVNHQMPNLGSNMVYMQYPMNRYPYMSYPPYMPKQG